MIARLAVVGLAVATAAGGIAVAVLGPWPLPASASASGAAQGATRLPLPAAAPAVTCSGPETSIAPEGAEQSAPAGVVTLTAAAGGAGAARAAVVPIGAPAATAPTDLARLLLDGKDVRVGELGAGVREPLRLAAGTDAGQTGLAAIQTTLGRTGDRRGLAAVACTAATTDAWLVGGATSTGRRARLLLVDPTPAPAVVDVVLLGPRGRVDLPSARGVVVAPGRARALQLDALAPGLDRLAVHVVARRGRVTAVLDDSRLDGATPAGVDDVPVGAPPARALTLPGVVVPVAPTGGAASTVVRLAVPGGDDAVVHLRLAGPGGSNPLPGNGVVTVPAGSVVDVPLVGLRPGAYAVLADADVPVVAGAVVRVAGARAGPLRRSAADVGWTASARPLVGDALTALPRPVGYGTHGLGPAAGIAQLTLTAGGADADVTLRQVGPHGERLARSTVHVPAHRTTAVTLDAGAGAVAFRTDAGRPVWAGIAVTTPDPAGPLLTLLPVPAPPATDHAALAAVADPWLTVQSSQSSSLP